jgi:hypothetical protein
MSAGSIADHASQAAGEWDGHFQTKFFGIADLEQVLCFFQGMVLRVASYQ